MAPIRILLADDHPLIRAGIHVALAAEPDFLLLGEAEDGHKAIQLCAEFSPDILLLDLAMPGPSTRDIIQQLDTDQTGIKIIILTAYDDEAYIRGLFNLGISGYVIKDEPTDALVRAIRAVFQGDQWFSRRVMEKMTGARQKSEEERAKPHLSEREMGVIRLLAHGRTNEQIVQELCISERTVRFHIEHLMEKLGAHNRTEAVVIALERDVIKMV